MAKWRSKPTNRAISHAIPSVFHTVILVQPRQISGGDIRWFRRVAGLLSCRRFEKRLWDKPMEAPAKLFETDKFDLQSIEAPRILLVDILTDSPIGSFWVTVSESP